MLWAVLAIVVLAFMPACGGGGGSGGSGDTDSAINVSPEGHWVGTFVDADSSQSTVLGLITASGEVQFVNFGEQGQAGAAEQYGMSGQISMNGSSGSGVVSILPPQDYHYTDPNLVPKATLSFEVVEKQSITGSYVSEDDSGSFYLEYSNSYEHPSALDLIEGNWGYFQQTFGLSKSLVIGQDGSFTGSDNMGCSYSGNISVINPSYNLYRVTTTISGCVQEVHRGLAHVSYETEPYGLIIYSSSDVSRIVDMFRRE